MVAGPSGSLQAPELPPHVTNWPHGWAFFSATASQAGITRPHAHSVLLWAGLSPQQAQVPHLLS